MHKQEYNMIPINSSNNDNKNNKNVDKQNEG